MLSYIYIIVLIYVVPRLFLYNREGDIELNVKGIDPDKIKKKTRQEIIDRLYHLVIYNEKKVRWPYYLSLSALASGLIIAMLSNSKDIKSKETLISTTLFVFAMMELPQRFESAHVRSIQTYEAGLLTARFNELNK